MKPWAPWLRARSIRASFLAINVPLVLIALLTLFGFFEYSAHSRAMSALHDKLERLGANQAAVLAESLWNLDHERVQLILEASADDPDIRGMAVYDDMDNKLGAVGSIDDRDDAGLTARRTIRYSVDGQSETIGTFVVALTDARIQARTRERIVFAAVLAGLVLLSVVVSAVIANRWTIEIPLQRLLDSIDRTESGGQRYPVRWQSHDEIGAVVTAFNRMQARQQRYEEELHRARDDLERRVAERTAEYARARDEAEAANKAKSGFLANMSHELRTPLNAIIGFAEIMENEALGRLGSPRYLEYAKDIRASGQHLLGLINDLLDLSKAEAGKLELNETGFDLRDVIEQALAMVQPRAAKAQISLRRVLVDDPPQVWADERKIKQVLLNLLSNAVKFTPAGGKVTVELLWDGTRPGFAVIDTGIGISEEDISQVMQPFNQVDSSFNRKFEGTGLGLPLAKSMVELHGGELSVDSRPGAGTRMTVRLPQERTLRSENMPAAAGQS